MEDLKFTANNQLYINNPGEVPLPVVIQLYNGETFEDLADYVDYELPAGENVTITLADGIYILVIDGVTYMLIVTNTIEECLMVYIKEILTCKCSDACIVKDQYNYVTLSLMTTSFLYIDDYGLDKPDVYLDVEVEDDKTQLDKMYLAISKSVEYCQTC